MWWTTVTQFSFSNAVCLFVFLSFSIYKNVLRSIQKIQKKIEKLKLKANIFVISPGRVNILIFLLKSSIRHLWAWNMALKASKRPRIFWQRELLVKRKNVCGFWVVSSLFFPWKYLGSKLEIWIHFLIAEINLLDKMLLKRGQWIIFNPFWSKNGSTY